jgi:hypothetical protein
MPTCTRTRTRATRCVSVYLVIDPVPEPAPRPLDAEEFIEIERGVPAAEVVRRVFAGELNVFSGYACLMALHRLKEMGLVDKY